MADTTVGGGVSYPLTKMNFVVSLDSADAVAAFSEVNGIQGEVDMIPFRQGNSNSLAPIKLPGLVKHGNVTLKYGFTANSALKTWIVDCMSEQRDPSKIRKNVQIELVDINTKQAPTDIRTTVDTSGHVWILTNAWVQKYTGPDLNANESQVAIETIEIAYETLTIAV